ncbi:hypothetical protein PAT3040_04090 [Paenibacillus agaridevorans]|uniref:Uncharacterized protein n=1 Tax=Paenibacillus agaridevorans TaxID=171404 RepID=A0A2R5F170_9BACL|nr:DUF5696 domain-containing protein [Paenibacillus agaridevorans]GBG09444.1 hypothetical protein PAT3040_04090 [Paenibacillus agaridevorans]
MADPNVNRYVENVHRPQKWLQLWPRKPRQRLFVVLLLLAATLAGVIAWGNRDTLPRLREMGISERMEHFIPLAQGEAWLPKQLNENGFATVTENSSFTLFFAPDTTQIAVLDKTSGFLWRSNPSKDQLAAETVKGMILSNLESPFVLEYVSAGKAQRNMTNALEENVDKTAILTEQGVEITYHYPKLFLTLAIRYELTEHGLEVTVPTQGIQENGDNYLFSLQLLPYFGAVSGTEEEGYLFVPDGPGGLVYYNGIRPPSGNRYDYMIYDDDPANLQEKKVPQEAIAYPVFGIKRGEQAYAAIVKDGKYTTRITAMPAGVQTSYHSIGAKFAYREEYWRKVSMMAQPVNSVQKERIRQDRVIEYRLLSGEKADYSGMAAAYRDYLLQTHQLPKEVTTFEHIPLQLGLVGGGTKDVFGGRSYVPTTTFVQAEQMIDELVSEGVAKMTIVYEGWQAGGTGETDRRFPVQQKLGGAKGLRQFTAGMQQRGFPVLLKDSLASMKIDATQLSMKTEGIRSIDTTVFQTRGGTFLLKPETAVRTAKDTIDKLEKLGVNGLLFDGAGSAVFRDYADGGVQREDTAHLYKSLLAYTQERLGFSSTGRGNDYSLVASDLLTNFPLESSYDYFVDETVPFYPMAVHGYVLYSGKEGNLRNEYDKEMLKAIEYGAIPFFRLTYTRSRELKGTHYEHVYSSEYGVWKERVIEEYKKFDQLAPLLHLQMVKHVKRAEGVYTMTYDDGTRVTVDYNSGTFKVEKGGAYRE